MMRHRDEEIDAAARRFDELTDAFDPDSAASDNIEELAWIAAASATVREDEQRLRRDVLATRANGRSWNEIAVALGVSRQAARQRFSAKTSA